METFNRSISREPGGAHSSFCAGCSSRRTFLAGFAAFAAGALVSRDRLAAQGSAGNLTRIDVHAHFVSPGYIAQIKSQGQVAQGLLDCNASKMIESMDQGGVATSITSVSPPGMWFGDVALARRLSRDCNEYAARLASDHRGRFGIFVNMPMPDVDSSLKEIEYGLDTLKADGIAMFTSYGDKWLGDPAFAPVFEELNRRKAVIYTHPISANCCRNIVPGLNDGAIEWGTDTTRAIARMVFGGAAVRYPDIRMIFSHAGGTMPFLIERFVNLAKGAQYAKQLPQGFLGVATKFYYDIAQTSNPAAMSALRKVVPLSQIVFGSDYPYRTQQEHVIGLKECGVFNPTELLAIDRENALTLLPRYKS